MFCIKRRWKLLLGTPNEKILTIRLCTQFDVWFRAFAIPRLDASVLDSSTNDDEIFKMLIQSSRISTRKCRDVIKLLDILYFILDLIENKTIL